MRKALQFVRPFFYTLIEQKSRSSDRASAFATYTFQSGFLETFKYLPYYNTSTYTNI